MDDGRGIVRWKRQLGLVCAVSPVALKLPGAAPLFLAVDQGGALFNLDPERYVVKPGADWLNDAGKVFVARNVQTLLASWEECFTMRFELFEPPLAAIEEFSWRIGPRST